MSKSDQLEQRLHETVQNLKENDFNAEIKVSVYDIKSGIGANVRGDDKGWSASIIKVPIMVATLREIEQKKLDFRENLVVDHKMRLENNDPVSKMRQGRLVRVYDLIGHMITVSDNEATNMLANKIGIPTLNKYFKEFKMEKTILGHLLCPKVPRYTNSFNPSGSNLTSPNDMTGLFKKLYDQSDNSFSEFVKVSANHFLSKTYCTYLHKGGFFGRNIKSKGGHISSFKDGRDTHEVGIIDDSLIVSIMMNKIKDSDMKYCSPPRDRLRDSRKSFSTFPVRNYDKPLSGGWFDYLFGYPEDIRFGFPVQRCPVGLAYDEIMNVISKIVSPQTNNPQKNICQNKRIK